MHTFVVFDEMSPARAFGRASACAKLSGRAALATTADAPTQGATCVAAFSACAPLPLEKTPTSEALSAPAASRTLQRGAVMC